MKAKFFYIMMCLILVGTRVPEVHATDLKPSLSLPQCLPINFAPLGLINIESLIRGLYERCNKFSAQEKCDCLSKNYNEEDIKKSANSICEIERDKQRIKKLNILEVMNYEIGLYEKKLKKDQNDKSIRCSLEDYQEAKRNIVSEAKNKLNDSSAKFNNTIIDSSDEIIEQTKKIEERFINDVNEVSQCVPKHMYRRIESTPTAETLEYIAKINDPDKLVSILYGNDDEGGENTIKFKKQIDSIHKISRLNPLVLRTMSSETEAKKFAQSLLQFAKENHKKTDLDIAKSYSEVTKGLLPGAKASQMSVCSQLMEEIVILDIKNDCTQFSDFEGTDALISSLHDEIKSCNTPSKEELEESLKKTVIKSSKVWTAPKHKNFMELLESSAVENNGYEEYLEKIGCNGDEAKNIPSFQDFVKDEFMKTCLKDKTMNSQICANKIKDISHADYNKFKQKYAKINPTFAQYNKILDKLNIIDKDSALAAVEMTRYENQDNTFRENWNKFFAENSSDIYSGKKSVTDVMTAQAVNEFAAKEQARIAESQVPFAPSTQESELSSDLSEVNPQQFTPDYLNQNTGSQNFAKAPLEQGVVPVQMAAGAKLEDPQTVLSPISISEDSARVKALEQKVKELEASQDDLDDEFLAENSNAKKPDAESKDEKSAARRPATFASDNSIDSSSSSYRSIDELPRAALPSTNAMLNKSQKLNEVSLSASKNEAMLKAQEAISGGVQDGRSSADYLITNPYDVDAIKKKIPELYENEELKIQANLISSASEFTDFAQSPEKLKSFLDEELKDFKGVKTVAVQCKGKECGDKNEIYLVVERVNKKIIFGTIAKKVKVSRHYKAKDLFNIIDTTN